VGGCETGVGAVGCGMAVVVEESLRPSSSSTPRRALSSEKEYFIDNLLVQIH